MATRNICKNVLSVFLAAVLLFSVLPMSVSSQNDGSDEVASKIVREVIVDIGYDRAKFGFDGNTCSVITSIDEQSGDIAMGVNEALESKDGSANNADAIGAGYDVWLRL